MTQVTLTVDGILFDMDGTLIDSTAGVVGAWETFAKSYPGIDVQEILSTSHGVRTVDNLKKFCGMSDPEELEKEAIRFEQVIVTSSTENGRAGIVKLPGATEVLSELAPGRYLPNPCWAICTSATRAYATSALAIANIPIPEVFVVAEDVKQGKPFPDPYLLGAEKSGVKPEKCIVFEDAPNGVRSGKAAGCTVIALLTTHARSELEAAGADYIVKDLTKVITKRLEQGVQVVIDQA